jgi:NitT/TauT family transport system permease protein
VTITAVSPPQATSGRRLGVSPVVVGRILFGLLIAALWQWGGTRTSLTEWVSNPVDIVTRLGLWASDGTIVNNLSVTLIEIIAGLVIGVPTGIFLGFALSASTLVRAAMMPWLTALYTIPLVAIAPLLILWMGVGINSKIFLVAIMTTFILTWNTFAGIRTVSPAMVRQMRLLGAGPIEVFTRCVFWVALPFIVTGIRTAVPYSLTGAVAGEMIATRAGVGFLIMTSAQNLNMSQLYAALVLLMLCGMVLTLLADQLERLTPRHRTRADDALVG